ncbi:MAG: hypothetical protein IKT46_00540 [Clostridia bacterium]|nr:hypothetical protein [Clostridia bacterium]
MGRGSYTSADWLSLRSSRRLDSTEDVGNIFKYKTATDRNSTRLITYRESRDATEGSGSTPIIIGFDVTASMGYLAKELATNSVHSTVTKLLNESCCSAPQILCAAIGDCKSDKYPLQVTQFESDIRIIEQLLELCLEGGGGGNNGESYNLLWYFAAHHTRHDHFDKRGKKGYIFTIGDDLCHPSLSSAEINSNFSSYQKYDISNQELLLEAQKRYHVFHIHIDRGITADTEIFQKWTALMPGRCALIGIKDIDCLSDLITTIITYTEGASLNDALGLLDQRIAQRIARSVASIQPTVKKNTISF